MQFTLFEKNLIWYSINSMCVCLVSVYDFWLIIFSYNKHNLQVQSNTMQCLVNKMVNIDSHQFISIVAVDSTDVKFFKNINSIRGNINNWRWSANQ